MLIDSESASQVTATSAIVEAQLNPLGVDTAYHFEYGLNASYGTSGPIPDHDTGAGESDVRVGLQLQDLESGATYHYRVVASSESSGKAVTILGPDKTFTTQASGGESTQVDGRQWELVSPPNKQGAGIYALGFEQGSDIQASESGDGITYTANRPFALQSQPATAPWKSRRSSPSAWRRAVGKRRTS